MSLPIEKAFGFFLAPWFGMRGNNTMKDCNLVSDELVKYDPSGPRGRGSVGSFAVILTNAGGETLGVVSNVGESQLFAMEDMNFYNSRICSSGRFYGLDSIIQFSYAEEKLRYLDLYRPVFTVVEMNCAGEETGKFKKSNLNFQEALNLATCLNLKETSLGVCYTCARVSR
jgi:hypothetical protein